MIEVQPYLAGLLHYIERQDYRGYDPYDAMNSRLLRWAGSRSQWMRVGLTQLLKRCPINLRPMLRVERGHNPKGIGLFLWGYARLYAVESKPRYRERIDYLLDLLERDRSEGYSGNCWGYNFGWQNWNMWTPPYTPTLVNSAFIGHALLDTYLYTGAERALNTALSIKDFICTDLPRHEEQDRLCFSYTPLYGHYVHNANLLGASLLIRLHRVCGDKRLEELALASLRYALHYQHDNGAWYYGETELTYWKDSFHTGFNLQALQYFIREGYARYCREGYDLGLKYYVENFFLPDGTAKYYDRKTFPVDVHSPCQGVIVLSDGPAGQSELAEKILRWMFRHMWSPAGYFYFRKGRFHTNRISYMRWSQAWAFNALTSYLCNQTCTPAVHGLHGSPVHANLD